MIDLGKLKRAAEEAAWFLQVQGNIPAFDWGS
jgi:hypothetical protein